MNGYEWITSRTKSISYNGDDPSRQMLHYELSSAATGNKTPTIHILLNRITENRELFKTVLGFYYCKYNNHGKFPRKPLKNIASCAIFTLWVGLRGGVYPCMDLHLSERRDFTIQASEAAFNPN